MSSGVLVAFEGIDGAGTTTQAARYAEHLRARGRAVHLTRQPSDLPIGKLLRQALRGELPLGGEQHAHTMALLFAADRLDHVAREVTPQLAAEKVVLSDRYVLSSIVYQSATAPAGSEGFEAWVRTLNRAARPADITVLLDVDPDVAAKRRNDRAGQQEIYETSALQRELARRYRAVTSEAQLGELIRIDGNLPLDEVTAQVTSRLDALLGAKEGSALNSSAPS